MGKIVEKLLEVLQIQVETTVSLLDLILAFPRDLSRVERRIAREGGIRFKRNWAEMYRARQSFYSLLNQLKRDGLITKQAGRDGTVWEITPRGSAKLYRLKENERKKTQGEMIRKSYIQEKIDGIVIVSFDIPERERRKRAWLRFCLNALDFELLQKSVWIGRTKIPEEFIKDLRAYKMISYVHIFTADRKGTLTKVV